MNTISLKAKAKINITLDVVGKRDTGYHEVEMVMHTIELHDHLVFKKIPENKIEIHSNLRFLPTDCRNLIYQVIEFVKRKYHIRDGLSIDITKMIPVAGGMAGGSSDAAQSLVAMNQLFDLGMTLSEMMQIGVVFGSDIPYCLLGGTAFCHGLGEQIIPLNSLFFKHVLVVRPKYTLPTKFVYNRFDIKTHTAQPTRTRNIIQAIEDNDYDYVLRHNFNVLEPISIAAHPVIATIKEQLTAYGGKGVLMSGSGPSVYGIFDNPETLEVAKQELAKIPEVNFVFETSTAHSDEQ